MANIRMKDLQFPGLDNTYTFADEAPEYSSSSTYAVGDFVIYDGKLYRCKTAIDTAEVWTAAHWEETKIGNEVTDVNEKVDQLEPSILGMYSQDTITNTAIASFIDGADDVPVKSLVVGIEPVQNLHGQEYPYPAGGSSNIFDGVWEAGTINIQTGEEESSDTYKRSANNIQVTYGEYCCVASGAVGVRCYANDNTYLGNLSKRSDNNWEVISLIENTAYVRLVASNTVSSGNVGFNYPSSVTTFSPYSNICPITGWTGANVYRTGTNVFDGVTEVGSIDSNGRNASSDSRFRSKNYIPVKPNTTYKTVKGSAYTLGLRYYDINKQYIGSPSGTDTFTTTDNTFFVRFLCTSTPTYNNDISINYPSTDTDYHAYDGTTYPISFPAGVGTVYGGTLDVTNGELKVTTELVTITDINGTSSNNGYARVAVGSVGYIDATKSLCNLLKYSESLATSVHINEYSVNNSTAYNAAQVIFRFGNDIYAETNTETIANYRAKLTELNNAGTPLQVLIYLAQPLIYQLTPTEVKTLLAINNIWADTGGVLNLVYRNKPVSDTDIQDQIDRIREVIADREDTGVASKNYASGSLVLIGSTLVETTASVSTGETFTVGTNCTETTVAAQIAYLKTIVDSLGNTAFLTYQTA